MNINSSQVTLIKTFPRLQIFVTLIPHTRYRAPLLCSRWSLLTNIQFKRMKKRKRKKEVGEKKVGTTPHALSLPLDYPHGAPNGRGRGVGGLLELTHRAWGPGWGGG